MYSLLPYEVRVYCLISLILSPIIFIVILVQNAGSSVFWDTFMFFPEIQCMHLYGVVMGKHHPKIVEMFLQVSKIKKDGEATH